MDWPQIVGGGLVGILMTALLAVIRAWVNDMRADRDFWRAMALGAIPVAERATKVAEAVVSNGSK